MDLHETEFHNRIRESAQKQQTFNNLSDKMSLLAYYFATN